MISDRAYRNIQRRLLTEHFDANETIFLERELTQLRERAYTVLFAEPVARLFLPKATDVGASAESYTFKVYRPVGNAAILAYDDNELPRVDVTADEVLGKVRPVGASYGWNINELREAARLGLKLSEVKATTAQDAIERAIDELIAFGTLALPSGNRPDVGLTGLAGNSLIAANGIVSGSAWTSSSDPADMLADLNALVVAVSNQSLDKFKANAVILPLTHYNLANTTSWSALTGETVMSVFKKNNPQIQSVMPWHKLNTVTSAQGGTDKPRGIAYQKDLMTGECVIPQEFEQMPPQMEGLKFIINCHARCGGAKIYQPLAFRYIDFA